MRTEKPSEGFVARVIDFGARRRALVAFVAVAFALFGVWAARETPLDALPDLSDTQVVIATEWMGRNPTIIEDQVTYPIATAFLGAPNVKTVRGFTMFGMSFVYVVFDDGTDIYWARARTLEYLSKVQARLPPGVTPQIGPDATSVGWVFQYALVDETGRRTQQELRSLQDWTLRYQLQSVDGVAEVASVGGFEKEYQIETDPGRLRAYGLGISDVAAAVGSSNGEVGGRVIELSQHEYAIRGRGYVASKEDIESAVISVKGGGKPITVGDVATVSVGGAMRRGIADLDGRGPVVGGIVVMRSGENALDVCNRTKAKLAEIAPSLPDGVRIVPVYDRSRLIRDSVATLGTNLAQIIAVVLVVIALFLFHLRSSIVAVATLLVATAGSFVVFWSLKLTISIMSLAGVILALGDMVDSTVVLVEDAHKQIAEAERHGSKVDRTEIIVSSAKRLGPSLFGALLVLTIAFLPVFALTGEEGRLFRPLAVAKTASMAVASLLAITLVPALMVWFLRGRIRPEERNPMNRAAVAVYRPVLRLALRARYAVIAVAVLIVGATVIPWRGLGSEFMPPLYEEDLLFMPVSVPSMPVAEAERILRWQDTRIREVPEVEQVFGKAGRAESALDPAPLSMFETIVRIKPKEQWRAGMTIEKIVGELDQRTRVPGIQGAWTMPIKARIDMLSTGIRTPIGIKVFGKDLATISDVEAKIERALHDVPGTRSVYAERELGGFFLDVVPKRDVIARYGLSVREVLDAVESSVGGIEATTTIEGRERYRVVVRYPRELRNDPEALKAVLVPVRVAPLPDVFGSKLTSGASDALLSAGAASSPPNDGMQGSAGERPDIASMGAGTSMRGGVAPARMEAMGGTSGPAPILSPPGASGPAVPLGQLADVRVALDAPMIKSELGQLAGWVYVDIEGRDLGGYVEEAKQHVTDTVALPPGYSIKWTGQYELLERVRARLAFIVPLTLALVVAILYVNFRAAAPTALVLTGVPFAAVGSIWTLWLFGFNTSVAVWVGMIALLGVAAETASVMVVYLEEAYANGVVSGRIHDTSSLLDAVVEAGALRVRPLLMTVLTNVFGLLPILLDRGVGSDVAKRIAAPMWGGLVSLTLLTLVVVPCAYVAWRTRSLRKHAGIATRDDVSQHNSA
ncbi:MAG: CusA/CzcA family heavy metal efflux RND transporter [Polyangiaceae bacterium]|nr:CusA/CzcA family heavy metal efflux RND transporter [Polyangiaceae bacterium]